MPYISIRSTSTPENSKDISNLVKDVTESVASVLNKPVDSVMVDLQRIDNLFIGGAKIAYGTVVEVKTFGHSSDSGKKEINEFFANYLGSTLKISKENIYIIYSDKMEWGYKGRYISK